MAVGKKEYNTIDDAIASYELALTQETHDEPQKAKTSQLLRVAQVPPPPPPKKYPSPRRPPKNNNKTLCKSRATRILLGKI